MVEYSGEKIGFNGSQPFELIDEKEGYDNSHAIKLKLKEGNTSNDVLQYLLPKTRINMLQEVIPSMNEIFIEKVSLIP
jgi:ABC-2 type transport system ATP-binding protein